MKKETVEEFLKRGGKIEKLKPGMAYSVGSLDKSKKPRWTRQEVESGESAKFGEYKVEEVFKKPGTYHDFDVGGDKVPVYVPTNKTKDE